MSFNPSGAQKVLDVGLMATLFCKVRMDDRIIQDPCGFQLEMTLPLIDHHDLISLGLPLSVTLMSQGTPRKVRNMLRFGITFWGLQT